MNEEGFNTFNEIADCYWWTSQDIKMEIDSIFRIECESEVWFDNSDDWKTVLTKNEEMSYRKFISFVRKIIEGR